MALSAEMIHNPHQQAQNHTQQNAGHHRKIKASIPTLIHNIARQTPQAKWQSSAERQKRAHANQQNPHYHQKLSGCV
jgi:hypothetical protein